MSPRDIRPPSSTPAGRPQALTRPLLPSLGAEDRGEVPPADGMPTAEASELTEAEYRVVAELRDRVSTRLTAEDRNYAAGPRRELTKKLIRDEYDSWLLHQANPGRAAPAVTTQGPSFTAPLPQRGRLGGLAPPV